MKSPKNDFLQTLSLLVIIALSQTCVPCKLQEQIVCSNIMAHLHEYQFLSDRQHAFRKKHRCETQLLTGINDWIKLLDKWGQVDTFSLEFEKSFITPPHELLTESKLFGYSIGGKTLRWIDSFLCYRTQWAVVNGETSEWAPVLSGVQGTVFGSINLLFSVCIIDISTNSNSEIRLLQMAVSAIVKLQTQRTHWNFRRM